MSPLAPSRSKDNNVEEQGKGREEIMAPGFHRSASLPAGPNPNISDKASSGLPPEKAYHVRSASLPCRSHPLVSQLEDQVRATRAWHSPEPEGHRSSAWLRSGLIRLQLLHLALDDLLQLPKTRDSLRRTGGRSSGLAENLLDDFLIFVDAYGSFRSALVSVQDLHSAAQVAIRRRDKAHLFSVARSLKKAEKEVTAFSSALRNVSKTVEPALAASSSGSSVADAELAGILREVKDVTVSVSTAVLQGTAAAMATVTAAVAPKSSSWTALMRRLAPSEFSSKKMDEEEGWARNASEKLENLEECIVALESAIERVFRSLMNTRVSLLNILTP